MGNSELSHELYLPQLGRVTELQFELWLQLTYLSPRPAFGVHPLSCHQERRFLPYVLYHQFIGSSF